MMARKKLVVVGNGMAGMRTLEELLKIAPDQYDITVFGAEAHPNYNRIMLSPVLAGEQTIDEIILNPVDWYAEHGITLHMGRAVVEVNRNDRVVIAADGTKATYDRLLLAIGSQPIVLPIPGNDLQGVICYRDIADTQIMIDAARQHQHAVVIGGGLLGLEAANGLNARGMRVTVIHAAQWLLERQLDSEAAQLLQANLTGRGLRFELKAQTSACLDDGHGRVRAVQLKDGSEIPADLVVMAVGVRPDVRLATTMGLQCNRGVLVNDTLQTLTDPRIYAVGECVNHRGTAYGLVAPLYEQARVCANHLADIGISRYLGSQVSTKLKVTGIDLFSAGDFMGNEGCEEIILRDPIRGIYKKLIIKNNALIGVCLYGDTQDSSWYFDLIKKASSVASQRNTLVFGSIQS